MLKRCAWISAIMIFALPLMVLGEEATITRSSTQSSAQITVQKKASFQPFTGKIIGDHVRMRVAPDLESPIVLELSKEDYVIVTGEKGEFYSVEGSTDVKAYIFRGFVIDGVVEGERVNVRLAPDREAPVIGHYSGGDRIDGTICSINNKWLEIPLPTKTAFYIAKEYVGYGGDHAFKAIQDKRKIVACDLLKSTALACQGELAKPFPEIDIDRITQNYQTIITDYADFSDYVAQATKELATMQERYLQRKITFLEGKANSMETSLPTEGMDCTPYPCHEEKGSNDRMKVWEPIEEGLYVSYATMHHAKTMDDFYADQKIKAQSISGIIEGYKEPIKNKPGDFLVKDRDMTIGYLYSIHVDLEEYIGKRVNLLVAPRSNNNFAFPAYYVLAVE